MDKRESHQVIIASPAQRRYQEDILEYLITNFSVERVYEIDEAIFKTVSSLEENPSRGTLEKELSHREEQFRFILHKESRIFEIKIIFYIMEESRTVFITDFFPTKMHPNKLK